MPVRPMLVGLGLGGVPFLQTKLPEASQDGTELSSQTVRVLFTESSWLEDACLLGKRLRESVPAFAVAVPASKQVLKIMAAIMRSPLLRLILIVRNILALGYHKRGRVVGNLCGPGAVRRNSPSLTGIRVYLILMVTQKGTFTLKSFLASLLGLLLCLALSASAGATPSFPTSF